MRFLPGGTVVVTSEVRQRVLEVDAEKGTIVREMSIGEQAGHMLATSPDGKRIYVPCVGSGKVVAIDAPTGEIVGTVETAHGAEGVDVSPDGKRIWVACNRSSSIAIIDADTLAVAKTIVADGFPFRVRCTPDGKSVVVSHPMASEVRVYDSADGAERGRVALPGGQPTSIALSVDGTRAFVVCGAIAKIAEIDLATLEVAHWYETGPGPDAIAVSAVKAAVAPG
jgi:YVTN family beta-propeller protein